MIDLSQVLTNAGLTPDQMAIVMAQFQNSLPDPLFGTGIKMSMKDSILTLEIDTSKDQGPSKNEKSILVACSHGFRDIGNGLALNLNLTRKLR